MIALRTHALRVDLPIRDRIHAGLRDGLGWEDIGVCREAYFLEVRLLTRLGRLREVIGRGRP